MDSPPIVLASGSPRRQELLRLAEIEYTVHVSDVSELMPADVPVREHALILARRKAEAVAYQYPGSITIAADTTVIINGTVINKPVDRADALDMLSRLSGRMHEVITGVCMINGTDENEFEDISRVYFKTLAPRQMEHYVDDYKPFDKAGAYAIQEWIGVIGIERIDGDYFNVMGLPINRVVNQLLSWGVSIPK